MENKCLKTWTTVLWGYAPVWKGHSSLIMRCEKYIWCMCVNDIKCLRVLNFILVFFLFCYETMKVYVNYGDDHEMKWTQAFNANVVDILSTFIRYSGIDYTFDIWIYNNGFSQRTAHLTSIKRGFENKRKSEHTVQVFYAWRESFNLLYFFAFCCIQTVLHQSSLAKRYLRTIQSINQTPTQ